MKVYASTACLSGLGLRETLDLYRQAGIRHVELGAFGHGRGLSPIMSLRDEPFEFVVHNYFPPPDEPFYVNLASADDELRRRSLDFVRQRIELTSALGSTLYSVHAGYVMDPIGFDGRSLVFDEDGDPDAALARFRETLAEALAHAAEHGVELIVENNVCVEGHEGKLLLQTAHEFEQVPEVGILVDTGHLNVSAHTLGFNRAEFVSRLAPRIRAYHLHDNDGIVDTHAPLAPGSWVLDLPFADRVPIVEARFANVEELRRHLDWVGQAFSLSQKAVT